MSDVQARRQLSLFLFDVLPGVLRVHLVLNGSELDDCLCELLEGPVIYVHAVVYIVISSIHRLDSMKNANAFVS